jgi:hypothetical protein
MSKMAEVNQEVTNRVRNSYIMIRDCIGTVLDNWDGSGTELRLDSDETEELITNLVYVCEVFRNDILPWLDIKTDDKGRLIDEE